MFERRVFSELRAEGRRLTGTVLRYGDVSPSHRERFEPGSLRLNAAVPLNLFHDPERAVAWHPGGGLTLKQDSQALTLRADLPPIPAADRALAEIRAGRANGLSVEFKAIQERRDQQGIRIIEKAVLNGIGLVRSPSYTQSKVEARKRSGRTMRTMIPADIDLACECAGAGCKFARFAQDALDQIIREVFDELERDAVASFGSYAAPLASRSRGTLRGKSVEGGAEIEIDIPDSAAGQAVLAAHEDAGVVARPFLDASKSDGVEIPREDGQNSIAYERASMRAIIVSSTDAREGWPDPQLVATPDELASRDAPRKRRIWL